MKKIPEIIPSPKKQEKIVEPQIQTAQITKQESPKISSFASHNTAFQSLDSRNKIQPIRPIPQVYLPFSALADKLLGHRVQPLLEQTLLNQKIY